MIKEVKHVLSANKTSMVKHNTNTLYNYLLNYFTISKFIPHTPIGPKSEFCNRPKYTPLNKCKTQQKPHLRSFGEQ
jgi:hypothetical protein